MQVIKVEFTRVTFEATYSVPVLPINLTVGVSEKFVPFIFKLNKVEPSALIFVGVVYDVNESAVVRLTLEIEGGASIDFH